MSEVITRNLDLWTSAILNRSTAGRGSNGKQEAYGIKKLRELILELAVHGKLLPQGDKWEQTSLGELGDWAVGSGFPKKAQGNEGLEILFAKVSDMNLPENAKFIVTTNNTVSEATATELRVNIHSPGTVIFPKIGGAIATNKRRILTRPTAIDNNCLGITPKDGVTTDWLYLLLSSIDFAKYQAGTSVPALSQGALAKIPVSLPGQAEQHSMVAKVDVLMSLSDQLEQQQTNSIDAHQTLVETLLGTLTNVETAEELSQAWTRIAEHFDTLFTTEHSIDQLKQTILQLAVMGKLVPQDPNDEPARVLLEKIEKEKARLIKEGKLKKQKPLPGVVDDEKTFSAPDGWEWARFDDLSLHSEAGWSPSCDPTPREGENWGVLKVSAVTWGEYNPNENKALPVNLEPRPEHEVMPGDFLISRANTADLVARAVVVPAGAPRHLMMSDKIIRFVFSNKANHEYLKLINDNTISREYYARVAGGTSSSMKNVSRQQIRNLVIALPPYSEQCKIVAKVDELMALCDVLKSRLAAAQTTQIHLADTIVEQAVA